MLRFSANLGFLWLDLPLVERIHRAGAAGFDAVEFHWLGVEAIEDLRKALQETGLPVAGVNTAPGDRAAGEVGLAALPGRGAEARASIDAAIGHAAALGAGYVHVTAGIPEPDRRDAARQAYLESLAHASEKAEAAGITVVIEPICQREVPGYFLRDTGEATEIIRELGRGNVKMLFDCYHVQVSEGDLARRFENLLPLIGHVQIAAVPTRREPDEGEIAYDRLLKAIEALGYDGFIGCEYRPRGTVEEGLGWLRRLREAIAADEREADVRS
jgi:hydroxypyruvate isomerase